MEVRFVIFGQRHDADGNVDLHFDICTEAEREGRTDALSKAGYEVYSGPCDSDLPDDPVETGHGVHN